MLRVSISFIVLGCAGTASSRTDADVPPGASRDAVLDQPSSPHDAVVVDEPAPSDAGSERPGPTSCTPEIVGCGVVEVPGGTFNMGERVYDAGAVTGPFDPEQPSISVDRFWLDRYEVTVARFRRYWDAVPVAHPAPGATVPYPGPSGAVAWPWVGEVHEPCDRDTPSCGTTLPDTQCNWTAVARDREAHPINCVDWATAQAFCVWDGGRLPTEAEWEFAARGQDGRRYPWGNLDDRRECSSRQSRRDGTCREDDPDFADGASPFGALHMSGNVWEFTADWFQSYVVTASCWTGMPQHNPLCTAMRLDGRSARGGSFQEADLFHTMAASRGIAMPSVYRGIGFRCVQGR